MNNVIGQDDLFFLISASVNKPPPDNESELNTASLHAVLFAFLFPRPVILKVNS